MAGYNEDDCRVTPALKLSSATSPRTPDTHRLAEDLPRPMFAEKPEVTEDPEVARIRSAERVWLPVHSGACQQRLSQFFSQWFDTAYPAGGGANRPMITGPGLAGPGFYSAPGVCG